MELSLSLFTLHCVHIGSLILFFRPSVLVTLFATPVLISGALVASVSLMMEYITSSIAFTIAIASLTFFTVPVMCVFLEDTCIK